MSQSSEPTRSLPPITGSVTGPRKMKLPATRRGDDVIKLEAALSLEPLAREATATAFQLADVNAQAVAATQLALLLVEVGAGGFL